MAIGWMHPFFLIPLSHLTFLETDKLPTLGVTDSGKVFVNPQFAASLTDRQLAGGICHEIMHLVLQHTGRLGSRERFRWNVATDFAINGALAQMGIELPDGALMPPYGDLRTAEEYYEAVDPDDMPEQLGSIGRGCGVTPDEDGDQDGSGGQGDEPGEGEEPGSGTGQGSKPGTDWEIVAHQAQAAARGTASMQALGPLLQPKPAAISWRTMLRATLNRVAASGGRDMQSATRRNRRSPAGVILPGWISHRPSVAIVIDSSGSMSDDMLTRAVAESRAIGEASGCRIFLALHDSACYFAGWIDTKGAPERLSRLMNHRGGTDAEPAYERVGEERARFDVLIHLTDGELGPWPALPRNARRLVAAIVGDRAGSRWMSTPPDGSTVLKVEI